MTCQRRSGDACSRNKIPGAPAAGNSVIVKLPEQCPRTGAGAGRYSAGGRLATGGYEVSGSPETYMLNGKQYVLIAAVDMLYAFCLYE